MQRHKKSPLRKGGEMVFDYVLRTQLLFEVPVLKFQSEQQPVPVLKFRSEQQPVPVLRLLYIDGRPCGNLTLEPRRWHMADSK